MRFMVPGTFIYFEGFICLEWQYRAKNDADEEADSDRVRIGKIFEKPRE